MTVNEPEVSSEFPESPWFSIWTEPRSTIQRIVDSDPVRHVIALAAAGGVFQALDRASGRSMGDELGMTTILLMAVILGSLSGIVYLYITGALVRWTGRWLGGEASSEHIRAAIAWGSVPALWTSLLWIPELAMFGPEMFTTEMPRVDANPSLGLVFMVMVLIELGGAIWSIVTSVKCLGQVQGFSAWKALANFVLALLVIIVPLVILIVLLLSPEQV